MLFTYQKKTQKLITNQTTNLPAVQEKGNVQIDVNYNTNTNSWYAKYNTNMFNRVEKTTKCSSCNH